MNVPGNAMPAIRGFAPTTDTYVLMSSANAGSFGFGPTSSIATVFRIP